MNRLALRQWLNHYIGIPAIALLRGWVLNCVIACVPIMSLRYTYYRAVCGIKIGKNSLLWMGSQFTGSALNQIEIGERCSIGYDSFWVAGAAIKIGNDVIAGHRVEFYTSDHDPDAPEFSQRDAPIIVGDRVWIGSRAIILKGVTIGTGAVVAAGSLVTKDIEPYAIVAGQPARFIRRRGTTVFTYHVETRFPFL